MEAPLPLAGRYRFLRRLMGASSGVIWLASDPVARRTVVASSVTSARVAGIRNSLGLTHPHLVTMLDLFEDVSPNEIPGKLALRPGMAIAVAEHVKGQTLQERLELNALSAHEAVSSIAKIANALHLLHSHGAVHGSISSRSVIVARTDKGTVPIVTNLRSAANGAYCSPERVRGGGPSIEDDTWALYATLFAALTRQPPYAGTSRESLAKAILSGMVPNLAAHGVHDEGLQFVLQEAFRTDWESRHKTVAGLEMALATWLRSQPDPSHGESFRKHIPSEVDDDQTVEALTTAVPPRVQKNRRDLDDDDALATVQLESSEAFSEAIRQFGSPLGADPFPAQRPFPPQGVSPLPRHEMETEAETLEAMVRNPMASETINMDPAMVDALRMRSVQAVLPATPEIPNIGLDDDDDDDDLATVLFEPHKLGWSPELIQAQAVPPRIVEPPIAVEPPMAAEPPMADALADGLPPHGPQRGWGPAEPSPPLLDPNMLLTHIEQEQAQQQEAEPGLEPEPEPINGFIDPGLVQPREEQAIEPLPRKKRSRFWLVVAGMILMLFAATGSFIVAVKLAGGNPWELVLSLLDKTTDESQADPSSTQQGGALAPKEEIDASASANRDAEATDEDAAAHDAATIDAEPPSDASPSIQTDLRACVKEFFPKNTFIREVPFDYICTNDNPRKAAMMLHQQLVVGGAGMVTEGMKLWSSLGWYELAVVVTIRDACCQAAPPIDLPETGSPCDPMTETLHKVSRGGCSEEEASRRAMLFENAIRCLIDNDIPRPYRYQGAIRVQQKAAFEQFLKALPPSRCSSP